MKKLIIWLVSRYNKKAKPEDQLRVDKDCIIVKEKLNAVRENQNHVKNVTDREKLDVTTISRSWMELAKDNPELRYVIDRSFVDWVIKEFNKGLRRQKGLELRPTEIKAEYIKHLVAEFNLQGYNARCRIDIVDEDNLKESPVWLIERYNEVFPENLIEVRSPVVFAVSITSQIVASAYKTKSDKTFLQNIINEKKYDLRQQLINQLNKSSFIKEEVEIREKEISIKLQIKAFKL